MLGRVRLERLPERRATGGGAIDHLVLATPDLDAATRDLEALLGVAATAGGRHLGLGTRNALIGLGGSAYLEVIGRDGTIPAPDRPRPFGIDALPTARLATWAVETNDVDASRARARRRGVEMGSVRELQRRRDDGVVLSWRLCLPRETFGGVVPFLIDWGVTDHPSALLDVRCRLVALEAGHPEVSQVSRALDAGAPLKVVRRAAPQLRATIRSPNGVVVVR
jgi:hypothetical protein